MENILLPELQSKKVLQLVAFKPLTKTHSSQCDWAPESGLGFSVLQISVVCPYRAFDHQSVSCQAAVLLLKRIRGEAGRKNQVFIHCKTN